MRVDDLLRRIDDAIVPPLGRLLDRLRRPTGHTGLLTVVSLVSVTVVLATAVWVAERPREDAPSGEVVRVGVPDGVSVPSYLAESRRELDELSARASGKGDPYALVMFSAYLAPDRLPTVLDGAPVSEVFTRVPLPGMQTQIARMPVHRVPDDVVAGMLLFAERKEREAHDYQDRAVEVTGTPDEGRLRPVYETAARVAIAEATAYRTHCSCVYAAVLRAAPPDLKRLAARPGVRAVDPAPEVRTLDRAVFLPPLPEPNPAPRPTPVEPTAAPPEPTALPAPTPSAEPSGPTPEPPTTAPTEAVSSGSPEPG
ncbi:hypothetical protein Ais01nite_60860 [Asanoa ishikariensis]|uniref:Uncharacterized protein n=1 Tax=Asanoa ishikariensis TaxID=137265 RepID=A0A1H3P7F6_9ACTN|nr:hypothetical protein [Asanoa ishikariensis]GIF68051.1 hypothetical protein Ais01nite_60860 [Asanoa ishikariensis]SDY97028.1 hypothetical protein SAMN05421684_2642 [Asanoa ishikariensis]